jgi:hypothetical protein
VEPARPPSSASPRCAAAGHLIEVRQVVGLRNSGHTIAKLLPGCSSGGRCASSTTPIRSTARGSPEFIAETRADALLMRGTEGEPVADARRLQKMDVYLGGIARPELSLPGRPASSPSCRVAAAQQRRGDHRPLDRGGRERNAPAPRR